MGEREEIKMKALASITYVPLVEKGIKEQRKKNKPRDGKH